MDLQSRKLNAIEYLISLKDEEIFKKIESTIFDTMKSKSAKNKPNRFSSQELIDRANRSNLDYEKGNYKTQEELEKESENW